MKTETARTRITAELADAIASRKEGREGRARVCARRAAGLAVASYYECRHAHLATHSAFDLLKLVQLEEELPTGVRLAAARLSTRVTTSGQLPHPQDPLDDARMLIETLLAAADRAPAEKEPRRAQARGRGDG